MQLFLFHLSVRSAFIALTYLLNHSAHCPSCPVVLVLWLWESPKCQSPPLTHPSQNGVEHGYSQIVLAVD